MRYVLIGAVAAATVASPAFAQDDAPPAPFTGAHVEALAGYDHVGGGDGADGFLYGIGAGYDFQLGGAVLGIEGELSDATTAARDTGFVTPTDSLRIAADRDLYIGGRIGVAVAPRTLLYAKGGYTNTRFKTTYNNGAGTVTESGNTLDGYRIGAGIEQKFNLLGPGGFVKAEYRYSNYRNLNAGGTTTRIDLDRHQGLVAMGIRF